MPLKTMEISEIIKAIQNQKDVLTPAGKIDEELFKSASCPNCGNCGCQKVIESPKIAIDENGQPIVISSPFNNNEVIPKGYAKCNDCDCEFDPKTGIIHRSQNATILYPHSDPH